MPSTRITCVRLEDDSQQLSTGSTDGTVKLPSGNKISAGRMSNRDIIHEATQRREARERRRRFQQLAERTLVDAAASAESEAAERARQESARWNVLMERRAAARQARSERRLAATEARVRPPATQVGPAEPLEELRRTVADLVASLEAAVQQVEMGRPSGVGWSGGARSMSQLAELTPRDGDESDDEIGGSVGGISSSQAAAPAVHSPHQPPCASSSDGTPAQHRSDAATSTDQPAEAAAALTDSALAHATLACATLAHAALAHDLRELDAVADEAAWRTAQALSAAHDYEALAGVATAAAAAGPVSAISVA
jgi:hypothetical protein